MNNRITIELKDSGVTTASLSPPGNLVLSDKTGDIVAFHLGTVENTKKFAEWLMAEGPKVMEGDDEH